MPAEIDVAAEFAGFWTLVQAVDADVDDDGAGFDHVGRNEAGPAHGRDDDVGAAGVKLQVAGAGVADGDRGAGIDEQQGHGLADNVGTADDHGFLAIEIDAALLEHLHHAVGRAGDESRVTLGQGADVLGVKTIHVLAVVDGQSDALFVNMFGQGQLYDKSVHVWIIVELSYYLQHRFFRSIGR